MATMAETKNDYLLRPDLGRSLSTGANSRAAQAMSARALTCRLRSPTVFLQRPCRPRCRRFCRCSEHRPSTAGGVSANRFWFDHARVGVLNDIGETLNPTVVVLLIGERPGLATAESLSAYMAFRPRAGHDDSQRNLISNIHARGVKPEHAAERIGRLAESHDRPRSERCYSEGRGKPPCPRGRSAAPLTSHRRDVATPFLTVHSLWNPENCPSS